MFLVALLVAPFTLAGETDADRYAWGGAGVVSAGEACHRSFFDKGPVAVGGPCDRR